MILSVAWKTLKHGLRDYSTNTSIHGFRYFVDTKSALYRLAWAVALVCSLTVCRLFISQTLREGELYPTITSVNEVVIDEIPSPAFSILVPKLINYHAYDIRLLNAAPACDSSIDFKNHPVAKYFMDVVKKFNSGIRSRVTSEKYGHTAVNAARKIKQYGLEEEFYWFCSQFKGLSVKEASALYDSLTERVDSSLLSTDLRGILKIPRTLTEINPQECGLRQTIKGTNMPMSWLELVSPIQLRRNYNLTCSNS